jgi:2'-5' RNA ligase
VPRCFVAIELEDEVRAALAGEIEELRPLSRAVAWVPVANLHLTLRFLGEQGEARVAAAVESLEEAAAVTAPFGLGLHGIGGFPGLERPRILWVGAAEGSLEARALQGRVETALERRGFGREARPWHPHVTIGRVFDERRWRRDRGLELRSAMARGSTRGFGTSTVRALTLVRSDLSPAGARYSAIASVGLAGA